MSLSSTTSRVEYAGDGSTVAFSFPYYFLANGDLVVKDINVVTGATITRVLTTDYSVTGAGVAAGGTVTMGTAPASGHTLQIYRDPAITQGLDLVENDGLPAEDTEKALDRLTMICQRLADRITTENSSEELEAIIGQVGEAAVGETEFSLTNGQSAASLSGLLFDYTVTRSILVEADVQRVTATQSKTALLFFYAHVNPTNNQWVESGQTFFGDALQGITLSITTAGQLKAAATTLTGGTDTHKLRIRIRTFGQS